MKLDNDFSYGETEVNLVQEELESGFKKYMHIERFGEMEVEGIEFGECFIFPKIDGTNSQLWYDGELKAGSRNRELSLDNDNQGFFAWAIQQENIAKLFLEYPYLRLYGEWLVPHTLKTYREDAWRKFYVFDVGVITGEGEELMPYLQYQPLLEKYNIDYIPPICSIKNATYENLINKLESNLFLIEDGRGVGEGIVIKNYSYRNKYGRQIWAKIVRSEFKEKQSKIKHTEAFASKMVEQEIIDHYLTKVMIEKVKANIENECGGWSSKYIPRLLSTVFYEFIKEESWNFVKGEKLPIVNFKTLNYLVIQKIKETFPQIF